jgi:hypothetical protein
MTREQIRDQRRLDKEQHCERCKKLDKIIELLEALVAKK